MGPGERCTFRDQDYRRKLALTTIDIVKQLYLPPLHKYPPKGVDGPIIPLAGGQMFYIARVVRYQYFYEDEEGKICMTTNFDNSQGSLLFFADLVLYDEDEQPALLVTSNSVKKKTMPEVQAALARLRINTLYLTIPQESPEAIHRSLMNGKNAKWIYHDDERQFDYLSLSDGITEGIPAIDGDSGQLFEESFDCRKVQINNLIRAINRCLGAESYRIVEQRARAAIGKTQLAISRVEEQRGNLEEFHRMELEEQYQPEFDGIAGRREALELAFDDLRDRQTKLEERYRAKNSDLESKGRTVDADLRAASLAAGGTGKTTEELEDDLARTHDQAIERLGEAFGSSIKIVERATSRIKNRIREINADEDRLRKQIEDLPDKFGKIQAEEEKRFDQEEQFEDDETARLEAACDCRSATFEAAQRQIDVDFAVAYPASDAGLPPGFDHILSDGPLNAATHAYRNYVRLRKAKEFLDSTAGKAWLQAYPG